MCEPSSLTSLHMSRNMIFPVIRIPPLNHLVLLAQGEGKGNDSLYLSGKYISKECGGKMLGKGWLPRKPDCTSLCRDRIQYCTLVIFPNILILKVTQQWIYNSWPMWRYDFILAWTKIRPPPLHSVTGLKFYVLVEVEKVSLN